MRGAALLLLTGCLALPACAASLDRQIHGAAFESCKGRQGEARERCIAGERQRLGALEAERRDACLTGIAEQEDRAAMRRGERPGDPLSEAASADC